MHAFLYSRIWCLVKEHEFITTGVLFGDGTSTIDFVIVDAFDAAV